VAETIWSLNPTIKLPEDPDLAAPIIQELPLFNNHLITDEGRPLKGPKWTEWQKAGIRTVQDLRRIDSPSSFTTLKARSGQRLAMTDFTTLRRAVPAEWLPPPSTPPPTPQPLSLLRPEHVRVLGRPLDRDSAKRAARARPKPLPKGAEVWQATAPGIPWRRAHKALWKAPVPHKLREVAWLIMRRSLYLGATALSHKWDGIPLNCHRCPDSLETLEHLFRDCPLAQACWTWCRRKAKDVSEEGPLPPSTLATAGTLHPITMRPCPAWTALFLPALFTLWTARNRVVHGGLPPLSNDEVVAILEARAERLARVQSLLAPQPAPPNP
jgi:hypothetical protein